MIVLLRKQTTEPTNFFVRFFLGRTRVIACYKYTGFYKL